MNWSEWTQKIIATESIDDLDEMESHAEAAREIAEGEANMLRHIRARIRERRWALMHPALAKEVG